MKWRPSAWSFCHDVKVHSYSASKDTGHVHFVSLARRLWLTCSTTMPARSRNISLRSEMDCTICRISLSLSSTITVFCSTRASWSSVNPWERERTQKNTERQKRSEWERKDKRETKEKRKRGRNGEWGRMRATRRVSECVRGSERETCRDISREKDEETNIQNRVWQGERKKERPREKEDETVFSESVLFNCLFVIENYIHSFLTLS